VALGLVSSKLALAVARMALPLFLCVWPPVEGLMLVGVIALAVGMWAVIDVTAAIFLLTPAHPVTTP